MTFLESRRSHVAPLLFQKLEDWEYVTEGGEIGISPDQIKPEIMRSRQYFAHLATAVAFEVIEMLLAPSTVRKKGILVIGFLNSFLDEFAAFLEAQLAWICAKLWNELPQTFRRSQSLRPEQWDYRKLCERNLLSFCAMEKAGGRDCRVCFFCCPRRQRDDLSWAGDALQKNLLYVALTRASWRLWVVLEDLRPCEGNQHREHSRPPRLLNALMDCCTKLLQRCGSDWTDSVLISNESTQLPVVWRDDTMWPSSMEHSAREALCGYVQKVYHQVWYSYAKWSSKRATQKARRKRDLLLSTVFQHNNPWYLAAQLESKYCLQTAPKHETFVDVVEKYTCFRQTHRDDDSHSRCL